MFSPPGTILLQRLVLRLKLSKLNKKSQDKYIRLFALRLDEFLKNCYQVVKTYSVFFTMLMIAVPLFILRKTA